MKPNNRYRIPIGTMVYITTSVIAPVKSMISIADLPVIGPENVGSWSITKVLEFDENDRVGHAGGSAIELFQLPKAVNKMVGLSDLVSLYLCVGKQDIMKVEKVV